MDKINVYYTKLDSDFTKEKFDEYYNELPDILKFKIDRLKRTKSKIESVIGIKLLTIALSDFNFPKEILENIQYLDDGKPYIANSFCFNISHSENIVICACYNSSIGIDIEKIKHRNITKLASFLSNDEYVSLSKSTAQDKDFAKIWTQKEAFSKALGVGMNLSFANINITDFSVLYENITWYLYPLNIHQDYSCYICVADNQQNMNLKEVNL